jgi:hypothetical protein
MTCTVKKLLLKIQRSENEINVAESSKEGCGSKRAVLPKMVMMMIYLIVTLYESKFDIKMSFIKSDKVAHQKSTSRTRICNFKTAPWKLNH